jgi:hypothetical protein
MPQDLAAEQGAAACMFSSFPTIELLAKNVHIGFAENTI